MGSKYTSWLRNNNQKAYLDKMKLAGHPQDIIYATTSYINEGLKHPRKDNIVDFARGNILVDISGTKYSADVVIGFTTKGICELHDVVNLQPTSFDCKKEEAVSMLIGTSNKVPSRRDTTSSADKIVSQNEQSVNSNYMQENENHSISSAPTSCTEILTQLKNGKISGLEDAFLKTLNSVKQKENTVTEDGESYAINHFEISDIDTESNMQELAKMDSVYTVKSEKLERTGKKPSELFSDFFDSLGNSIYVEQFGDIALSKSSVKSEIRHGITAEKIVSIEAIPTVLKQGKIIFAERKSGSDVDRIVVCAPIKIGDTPYYMGVMLQRDTQNQRLYLHNVIIERETPNTSQADLLTTGALEENEHLSMTNILQKALSVKNKYMQGSEDYSISSAPTSCAEILTQLKNGEISGLEDAFLKTLNSVKQKENTVTEDGEADAYSINESFYSEFDAWDGTDTNKVFTIGTTSEALKSINVKSQEIKMRSGMVLKKLSKHPEISREIFRSIPDLLEKPIIVQFSDAIDPKTGKPKYDSRITVLGELYADMVVDGKTVKKPVLVSLELLPTNQKKTKILDVSFVTSAYTKDALQQYINENSILYIDPNKKRTDKWLSLNRLSLPLGENRTGPIRKITYSDGKVKIQNSTKKTEMQLALEKAGVINSYGNSIFNDSENDASGNESFSISNPPTRRTEILTQLKNGEISVEEADGLLYNQSNDKSDTHYGEHIHHTPKEYKPESDREWQVFCRSFANHTNGMKGGEHRTVSMFTANAHYLISADGYMSGVIVDKVNIDEYNERKEFYDNIPRADVSNFRNEKDGRGQRNHSNSDIASQNEGADSFNVELDAFIASHPEWFANKGKTRSNYSREVKTENNEIFSISAPSKVEDILTQFKRGEISQEEAVNLLSKEKTLSPYEIAHLKPKDADITAEVGSPKRKGEGDKQSNFLFPTSTETTSARDTPSAMLSLWIELRSAPFPK